ncbi:MAG: DUF4238 domain-containing protein [Nitrososphaeraceae archaeon]
MLINMKKRRHHYVPEVLCKRFTRDWRNLYRIDCSELQKGAIPMSIKDAFVQRDLNTINIAGTRNTNLIEDFLDEIYERAFGKSINKIHKIIFENASDRTFDTNDYHAILDFCILSYLRTPKKLREIHVQTLRRSYLFSLFAKSNEDIPVVDNDYILTKTLLDGINVIKRHINGMTFRIAYHTFDDEYFLLADLPIALVNTNGREFLSPELDIILPVAKDIAIIFSKSESESDITHIQKRETIENINKQICINFHKYLACADKDYLEQFVQRNNVNAQILPEIENVVAEKERIIEELKTELEKNPKGRYIRVNKNGIELIKME